VGRQRSQHRQAPWVLRATKRPDDANEHAGVPLTRVRDNCKLGNRGAGLFVTPLGCDGKQLACGAAYVRVLGRQVAAGQVHCGLRVIPDDHHQQLVDRDAIVGFRPPGGYGPAKDLIELRDHDHMVSSRPRRRAVVYPSPST
jgi:hypothetical protein